METLEVDPEEARDIPFLIACNLITGFQVLPDRWPFLIACATDEEREKLPFQEKCCFSALRHLATCLCRLPGSSIYRDISALPPLSGSPRTKEETVPPLVISTALILELFSAGSSLKDEAEDGLSDTRVLSESVGVKVQY